MSLNRNKFGPAVLIRNIICFCELPCKAVGNTDRTYFSGSNRGIQRFHHFLNRRVVIPHVADVKINIIHAKIRKTPVQQPQNMLFSADSVRDLLRAAREKFRCNDNLIALRKIPQCASEILLTRSALITGCCIKKIHPELQSAF